VRGGGGGGGGVATAVVAAVPAHLPRSHSQRQRHLLAAGHNERCSDKKIHCAMGECADLRGCTPLGGSTDMHKVLQGPMQPNSTGFCEDELAARLADLCDGRKTGLHAAHPAAVLLSL
jgi:hypothetical protein